MSIVPRSDDELAAIRETAHQYIDRGWAVLLLSTDGAGGKIPPRNCEECDHRSPTYVRHSGADCDHLLCHGFYAATTNKSRFDEMLKALPHGHLAIRTGQASRLVVIDAEATSSKEGEPTGLEVLDAWESWTDGIELPETLTSRSVSGGLHRYYALPPGVEISSGRILPNVDIKGEYGYVGAPGVPGSNRTWLNPHTDVAVLPDDMIEWLRSRRRIGTGGYGGGSRPEGYDFYTFLRDGCPDGHRDFFFNDLAFRLRKRGLPRDQYEQQIYEAWLRCEQPPAARYEMPWEHVQYKLDRIWATVEPDPPSAALRWAMQLSQDATQRLSRGDIIRPGGGGSGASGVSGNGANGASGANGTNRTSGVDSAATSDGAAGGEGNGNWAAFGDDGNITGISPLVIGTLDPDEWYGTNDDGTALRMLRVWGDWFRAIKNRSDTTWLYYDGVNWQEDRRGQIWSAMSHVVDLIQREPEHWAVKCAQLEDEGVQDWRTQRVANGQNAGEFSLVVQLRKYAAECKNNPRKEAGLRAFARRVEIAISEEDLDAETQYVALADGRVLDVRAIHEGKSRKEWLLPARPDMLLTKQMGCGYVAPDLTRPHTLYENSQFKKYLEGVLPDRNVRETLQEIVGYALLGEPLEKIIVLLHGPPDSGKTVLLEILQALFGTYAGWTDGQALIAGKAKSSHNEWLHNIRGLRLVLTPETAKGAKIDAAWMKSYTGREPQTSRGAYGARTVTWLPTGIIFNASNHYLEYDAEDTAVAERTIVIEFERQFLRGDPERDETLPQHIKDHELPILLNWAIAGLQRHGARKNEKGERSPRLRIANKIQEWSARYRKAQDHVGQFILDAIEEGHLVEVDEEVAKAMPGVSFVSAKVVYELYRSWCVVQEIRKPLGRNNFNAHLKNVYQWKDVASGGKRWHGKTSPIHDAAGVLLVRW